MAAFDTSCYDNIVGLARTACPCADAIASDSGYNTSLSGLYVADLAPLGELDGFDSCGAGSVWDVLEKARDRAVRTFIADTNGMIAGMHKPRRKNWTGGVGRAERIGEITGDHLHAGIRIACAPVRGGFMRVTKIGGWFDTTGSVDINVYDRHNTLRKTVTIDTEANQHKVTELAAGDVFELPLFDDYLDEAQYFFTYTRADAPGEALQNRFSCGCGGAFKGVFDCNSPYYTVQNHVLRYGMQFGYADWIMAGGWTGDTLSDFDSVPATAPGYGYGLTIFAEIGCRAEEVLCKGELNFTGNPLAMSIAHAVNYKAGEYAALDILGSTRLNRAQMIGREVLLQNQANWRGRYNEHVNYIVANADLSTNDCFTCKSVAQMAVQGVFA